MVGAIKKGSTEELFFVYILLLSNGHYYCGYTSDVEKRMQKHLSGKGSKCVRSFRPVMLKRVWRIYGSKGEALKVESFIKRRSRSEKELLVNSSSVFRMQIRRGGLTARMREIRKYADFSLVKVNGGSDDQNDD